MFFRSGIGATGAMGARDLRDPGDLGGVRTTATFFTCCPGVLARLAGDLGVAGLLQPLRSGVLGDSAEERQRKFHMLNTGTNVSGLYALCLSIIHFIFHLCTHLTY